jgi:hypothetical protein
MVADLRYSRTAAWHAHTNAKAESATRTKSKTPYTKTGGGRRVVSDVRAAEQR